MWSYAITHLEVQSICWDHSLEGYCCTRAKCLRRDGECLLARGNWDGPSTHITFLCVPPHVRISECEFSKLAWITVTLLLSIIKRRWQLWSSHLFRVPSIQAQLIFVSISSKGPYYPVSGKSFKGPYYPTLIYFGNRCGAVPFPTRRWFNQFHAHVAQASFGGVQVEDVSTQLRYTRLNLRPLSGRGGGPRRRSPYLRSL